MELITILNHCHRHRGFVYQHARFGPDKKSIEVDVWPREGAAAVSRYQDHGWRSKLEARRV